MEHLEQAWNDGEAKVALPDPTTQSPTEQDGEEGREGQQPQPDHSEQSIAAQPCVVVAIAVAVATDAQLFPSSAAAANAQTFFTDAATQTFSTDAATQTSSPDAATQTSPVIAHTLPVPTTTTATTAAATAPQDAQPGPRPYRTLNEIIHWLMHPPSWCYQWPYTKIRLPWAVNTIGEEHFRWNVPSGRRVLRDDSLVKLWGMSYGLPYAYWDWLVGTPTGQAGQAWPGEGREPDYFFSM
ncbi:hypothetical protein BDV95DRAFT_602189 [Massariosphaeria phaeospora]|uniref:Uncharacterized protein n=1 Tax=Massariosphaeria phaeospora TaxID=100035 RepID=A0A7C8IFV8_9PLEO|nr:hypothetical protein BDV95DRAFT_602189 [Massariosphaeria phaeospora]